MRHPIFRLVLVASLALNLAFLGHLAWRYSARPPHPPGPPSPERIVEHLADRLSGEDAEKARAWAKDIEPEARAADSELRAAMGGLDAELRRDPLDQPALVAASERVHAAHQRLGRTMESLTRDLAPRLSADGRRALTERRHPRGGPPGPPPR